MKKQTILYGPPGVGKTFRLKKMALKLLHPNIDEDIEEYISGGQTILEFDSEILTETEIKNKFAQFYTKNRKFLEKGEYKPGKRLYRNMSSINKIMRLFIDKDTDTLTKDTIINELGWLGSSSYIQHARIFDNFELVEEHWSNRAETLTLNENGKALKRKYIESYIETNESFPDRKLPNFVIDYFIESLINTTSSNMTLWKNSIITTLWLGVEMGFVFKYKNNKSIKETEKERELLIKCCGYDNKDLSYLSWAVTWLEDLELVNKLEETDSRLIKYNLNNKAIKLISNLKIFAEVDTSEENDILDETPKKRYFIKAEQLKKENIINKLYSKYLYELDRIDVITMHASFSYEDFLEGITVKTDTNELHYYYKVGILKNISYRALKNLIIKNLEHEIIELNENEANSIKDWQSCFKIYKLLREQLDWSIADDYVLIIDEINRGDIVKVFGETITLLESDKRIGEKNEVIIKLPYTQEEFGIPRNVHMLCTMNTVDRSIRTMDIALRRRFNFIEVKPDLSLIKDLYETRPVDLEYKDNLLFKSADAVNIINNKIVSIPYIGADKLIGHSFLMLGDTFDDNDIIDAWKYDILPLLEELFYDQFSQLRMVLGYDNDNFINDTFGINKTDETEIIKFIDFLVDEHD